MKAMCVTVSMETIFFPHKEMNIEPIEKKMEIDMGLDLFEFEVALFMVANGLSRDEFERLEMLAHVRTIVVEQQQHPNETCENDSPSVLELFPNDPFSSFIN